MKKNLPAAPPPISEFRLPRYRELTDVGLYLEQVVTGCVIVVAIVIDQLKKRSRR